LEQGLAPAAHFGGNLLEYAIFGLDRWLRQRQGVYEFTSNPICMLRVNRATAEDELTLSDGTQVHCGDPILNLHLWNEQLARMKGGPTLSWATRVCRALDGSLCDLALCIAHRPEFSDIAALRADICIGTTKKTEQVARIAGRYGFETPRTASAPEFQRGMHRFGENLYMFLLVLATNPGALRSDVFSRDHALVYLPRTALERRYGTLGNLRLNREFQRRPWP
jgi:hypothetical protein